MENSDLVYQTFKQARNLKEAQQHLKTILEETYNDVEVLAYRFSKDETMVFDGIDMSISGSINEQENIAYAFEQLGLGSFGEPSTLLIARMITEILQSLQFKKTGYCGLMPPCPRGSWSCHTKYARSSDPDKTITLLISRRYWIRYGTSPR